MHFRFNSNLQKIALFVFLLLALWSCGPGVKQEKPLGNTDEDPVIAEEINNNTEAVTNEEDINSIPDYEIKEYETIIEDNSSGPDEYKVKLAARDSIFKNEPGELEIWIGAKGKEPKFGDDMVSDESTVSSQNGDYALVTPYAPDFDVSPTERCIKMVPSGSSVRFQITPRRTGTLKVSAEINIYKSEDCTGTPVPQVAAPLNVHVTVNTKKVVTDGITDLGTVVWDKFKTFWAGLITLVFGAIMYYVRKKLKVSKTDVPDA